jgi:RNA polymerase sigma-70 factor, ECF subfamily
MSVVSHAEELDRRTRFSGAARSLPPGDLNGALSAARDGDEDAFRTLYRDLNPRLLRYVRGLVGEEAEDVTSEAWLRIARDIAVFSGDAEAFRAWAATIARHRAFDHMRYRRRRPATGAPVDELLELPARDDTETTALDALSTQTALAMLGRLPHEQAEIILLRVVVGLDTASVAKILGKRTGTVRMAAHRGLRRLERLLDDPDETRASGRRAHE